MRAGDMFVAKQGILHDLRNTGAEDLRVLAFFSEPEAEQRWTEEVWEPGDLKVTRSRTAEAASSCM
jgi:mannose-6-phosphate isomerase-like protein (cupin superfamily)